MDPAIREHPLRGNFMLCIFSTREPGKHAQHSEAVGALAL